MTNTDVAIVGGGPAGLSAGLFTAKNGLDTIVFDTGETWMHKAHLYNYLGIRSMDGSVFQERAREHAVTDHGAQFHEDEEVTDVEQNDDGFTVTSQEGEYDADYIVLATGTHREFAESLDCEFTDQGVVDVDVTMETTVEDVYATGAMIRVEEWQAIIAAGDGGSAALNILSKEEGEHYHDFDTPEAPQ